MKKQVVIPTMICATTLALPVLHGEQVAIGGGMYMTVSPGPDDYQPYQPLNNGGGAMQQMVNDTIRDGAVGTVLVVGLIDQVDEVVGVIELAADTLESGFLEASAKWIADKLDGIIPEKVQEAVEDALKENIKEYDEMYGANYGIAYGYNGNYYYPSGYGC